MATRLNIQIKVTGDQLKKWMKRMWMKLNTLMMNFIPSATFQTIGTACKEFSTKGYDNPTWNTKHNIETICERKRG